MATLAKVVKEIIVDAIDKGYLVECGLDVNHNDSLAMVFDAEYGHNGINPKACKNYLQGLPSVCTIPFEDYEILEILAKHEITRKTEAGKYRLIDAYWTEAGYQFYKLVK